MSVTLYPGVPHRCYLGVPDAEDVYTGVLRQCGECYTWYVAKPGEYGRYWTKVRWYHRKANKRIAEYYEKGS